MGWSFDHNEWVQFTIDLMNDLNVSKEKRAQVWNDVIPKLVNDDWDVEDASYTFEGKDPELECSLIFFISRIFKK